MVSPLGEMEALSLSLWLEPAAWSLEPFLTA
jgi:hypothetical protein